MNMWPFLLVTTKDVFVQNLTCHKLFNDVKMWPNYFDYFIEFSWKKILIYRFWNFNDITNMLYFVCSKIIIASRKHFRNVKMFPILESFGFGIQVWKMFWFFGVNFFPKVFFLGILDFFNVINWVGLIYL
jgi:hypothetical protein